MCIACNRGRIDPIVSRTAPPLAPTVAHARLVAARSSPLSGRIAAGGRLTTATGGAAPARVTARETQAWRVSRAAFASVCPSSRYLPPDQPTQPGREARWCVSPSGHSSDDLLYLVLRASVADETLNRYLEMRLLLQAHVIHQRLPSLLATSDSRRRRRTRHRVHDRASGRQSQSTTTPR